MFRVALIGLSVGLLLLTSGGIADSLSEPVDNPFMPPSSSHAGGHKKPVLNMQKQFQLVGIAKSDTKAVAVLHILERGYHVVEVDDKVDNMQVITIEESHVTLQTEFGIYHLSLLY